jgi:basic membrane lipoprotein Med (substrate-binding protein (PBP1-ABC) superfamily)
VNWVKHFYPITQGLKAKGFCNVNMRKLLIIVLVLALSMAALPSAFAQDDMSVESVCLVTDLGRVNDGTFNQFAYEGMVQAVEEFELDSTFIETQAETDYAANIDTCVQEGYDVVVTVGFLIADATLAAAEANPEVYFIGVDQFVFEGPTNYVGIQFREDQAGFLVGVLAALVSESGTIAGVYGIDIPPVVKFRLGYEQGAAFAAEANGLEVETLGVYIDSFIAPDRGASAAEQFIGEGADVIFGAGGPTGTGGITAAAAQDVWVIGVDQDEYVTSFGNGETPGADKIISSALKRVDVGVFDMIAALAEGDMEAFVGGGNYVLDIANGGITFAPKHDADLDDAYYEYVAAIEALIADGTLETGVDLETLAVTTEAADLVEAVGEDLPELMME